jgi:hypothetical protein
MASSMACTGASGRDGTLAMRVSAEPRRIAMMSVKVPPISVPTSQSLPELLICAVGCAVRSGRAGLAGPSHTRCRSVNAHPAFLLLPSAAMVRQPRCVATEPDLPQIAGPARRPRRVSRHVLPDMVQPCSCRVQGRAPRAPRGRHSELRFSLGNMRDARRARRGSLGACDEFAGERPRQPARRLLRSYALSSAQLRFIVRSVSEDGAGARAALQGALPRQAAILVSIGRASSTARRP